MTLTDMIDVPHIPFRSFRWPCRYKLVQVAVRHLFGQALKIIRFQGATASTDQSFNEVHVVDSLRP